MSIAVEDWDELSDARRRRSQREAAAPAAPAAPAPAPADKREAPGAPTPPGTPTPPRARKPPRAPKLPSPAPRPEHHEDDYDDDYGESLRVPYSLAGANLAIFVLAHLTGVVEFLGLSFMASVGMLLAAYVLREWHRDRAALILLVGGLPLPLTIFSLLT